MIMTKILAITAIAISVIALGVELLHGAAIF